MNLSEIKKLKGTVWFLIAGTMLCKASYFISMPYLALRMKSALGLDPMRIGMTLGIGPLVGLVAGFYLGHLSDHWGRKWIFTLAILTWSLTFAGFGLATQVWQFALLNMVNGLCNAASQPVSAALISDLTDVSLRKTAFHLRYFAINVGASFGPLLGAGLLLQNGSLGFFMTAAVYLVYCIACALCIPRDPSRSASDSSATTPFADTMAAIAQDKPLMLYTLAFIIMGATYSQLDSTLPQFLQGARGEEGVRLFGLLIGINAMSVVALQIPLTRFMARFSLVSTVKTGSLLYGVGLALLGATAHHRIGMMASMVLLTTGEVMIFSNGNLLIDQIAPEDKKGAYFGASGLWSLGSTVGPVLGGYLLMLTGGPVLFVLAGALATTNFIVYRLAQSARLNRQSLSTFETQEPPGLQLEGS